MSETQTETEQESRLKQMTEALEELNLNFSDLDMDDWEDFHRVFILFSDCLGIYGQKVNEYNEYLRKQKIYKAIKFLEPLVNQGLDFDHIQIAGAEFYIVDGKLSEIPF